MAVSSVYVVNSMLSSIALLSISQGHNLSQSELMQVASKKINFWGHWREKMNLYNAHVDAVTYHAQNFPY